MNPRAHMAAMTANALTEKGRAQNARMVSDPAGYTQDIIDEKEKPHLMDQFRVAATLTQGVDQILGAIGRVFHSKPNGPGSGPQ